MARIGASTFAGPPAGRLSRPCVVPAGATRRPGPGPQPVPIGCVCADPVAIRQRVTFQPKQLARNLDSIENPFSRRPPNVEPFNDYFGKILRPHTIT